MALANDGSDSLLGCGVCMVRGVVRRWSVEAVWRARALGAGSLAA